MRNALTVGLSAVLALVVWTSPATAQSSPAGNQKGTPAARERVCAELADGKIEDVNLLSAAIEPASADHPEYCRVLGYVRPAVNFEVRLPTAGWNNNFYMSGCGGLCGFLKGESSGFAGRYRALQRGYAVALTDTGHWGRDMRDARWALSNPQARDDYAFRAVTETARVGKLLTERYYRRAIAKSYFNGCSNGGRQALIAAQRYPADFDGIIAGCAVTDMSGFVAQWIWNIQVDTGRDGKPVFDIAKLPMLAAAVRKHCGDSEGAIADPRRCNFDPGQIQCSKIRRSDCLTRAEVGIVRKWYAGPRLRGRQLHEGVPKGSEGDWQYVVAGHKGAAELMDAYVRYLITDPSPGPDAMARDFSLVRDLPRAAPMLDKLGADNPDLSAFIARGGKLLLYSGWGDAAATPGNIIAYYEKVAGLTSNGDVRAHVRLFLFPDLGHLPNGFDPLPVLERWVERGEAPEAIMRTKTDAAGQTLWIRPTCAYPNIAEYAGTGDRLAATSWRCVPGPRGPH